MRCHHCEGSIFWLAYKVEGKSYCSVTCIKREEELMKKENPNGEKESPPNGTPPQTSKK